MRDILKKHGFNFSKSLGQNFLTDTNVLGRIVAASGVGPDCGCLEIGAGAGVLTAELAKNCKKVVAVEIDKALLPVLNETLADYGNVTIINRDILKIDINELLETEFGDMPVFVTANLPYYITTPIIMGLLESRARVQAITVMVQKEVAERMAAEAGTAEYGALSVAVQYYTAPHKVCEVPPHCFVPQPKVASMVIRLDVLPAPSVVVRDEALFFDVVRSCFEKRRKTLANSLSGSTRREFDKAAVFAALEKMNLPADIRGERLSVRQFGELADML